MSLGIRSRFFSTVAALVVAFSALPFVAGAAPASSVSPFESVTVSAHDEQQGTMLFITGTLPADSALPANIELVAPAGSQLQWAGEILGGDLADDITAQPSSTETSGAVVHAFSLTKARTAQIEALTTGVFQKGASVTDVKLAWTPTTDVASVTLQVRLPQSAGISVPVEGAQTTQADPGFVYYSKTFTDAKAGQPLEMALSYVPGASGSGGPAAGATKGSSAVPFMVVIVALVAFLWFGFKVSQKANGRPSADGEVPGQYEFDAEDAEDAEAVDADVDAVVRPQRRNGAQEVVEEPVARRSKLPLYLTLAVVALMAVLVVVTSNAGGGVGVKQVTADSVSKIVADVDADATVVVPVAMTEGGDVEHESDHVFQALQTTPGVRKVSVALDGKSVTIEYASSQVGEAQIKDALTAGGYPPQQ